MIVERIIEKLEKIYISNPLEWIDVAINTYNLVSITIVSDVFKGKTFNQRHTDVLKNLNLNEPYKEGFFELFTVEEAEDLNLEKPKKFFSSKLTAWKQLSTNFKNQYKLKLDDFQQDKASPKVISFYSFKGGVGRTAALAHVAYILALRGKKVVIVDMDIEAPGMSTIFNPNVYQEPKFGLIDYFIDRFSKGEEIEKRILITDVFSEVFLNEIHGRLFIVPAGILDIDYLGKVDGFKAHLVHSSSKDYWNELVDDLNNHIKPDIILIDTRTGLNSWGALAILKISNSVVFFAYPNQENMHGLKVIIKAMKEVGYNNYNIIFSRIHDDKIGKRKAEELWEQIKHDVFDEPTDNYDEEIIPISEPIKIYYSSELAVADYYPIKNVHHIFSPIANLVDEEIEDSDLVTILSGTDRWEVIKSLQYEGLGFGEIEEDSSFFQKTVYVDKFLDEDVAVISGKKGTGKTKMYSMMLKHFDQIIKISRTNLENVIPISGHGDYSSRPIDEFNAWSKLDCSWEDIWKSYLLVVLEKNYDRIGRMNKNKYKPLKELVIPARNDKLGWRKEYTDIVTRISTDTTLLQLLQDYFMEIDYLLEKKSKKVWVHYDKLDEDLEKRPFGKSALEGLFKLIQIFEGKHIKNIKFKVFVRQDIWDSLGFTNKSHFKGKTIKLEWNQLDFLKLALKISMRSEEFAKIVGKYRPILHEIDLMDIDALKESLQILWGIRRESSKRSQYVVNWVYERLTDADENTFPRSLFMLLKGAKEQELTYEHSTNIQHPRDRLLRSASLNKGLKEASFERCDALRQEYDSIKEAFDLFSSFSDTFDHVDFEKVYKNTQWNPDELLKKLRKIGVISEKENNQFKFAYIYIDGFKIKRTSKI